MILALLVLLLALGGLVDWRGRIEDADPYVPKHTRPNVRIIQTPYDWNRYESEIAS